jgi:ribosomal peptide maturation radical SAM protein 1
MKRVLLLSMPFGAVGRQALGVSLLKARLAESSIPCDVRYFPFTFAEFIGYSEYQWMALELPYTAFAGDWSFTHTLYGERPAADRRYVQEVLRDAWQLGESDIRRILRVRSLAPYFLDHCMAALRWHQYGIIGFTSTFEQNIASLALASRIKAVHPNIAIVFGGANWEGEMGLELHRKFPFVDYVCSGEAEQSFPELAQNLLRDQPRNKGISQIRGVVYRSGGQSIFTGPADLVREMDKLPIPDFSDYFRDLEQSTVASSVVPTLLFESSRGCWWGAKSHCTFCGLNGGTMAFRSKSASRVLGELDYLVNLWHIDSVEAVDNILDMKYFNDVLPSLAQVRPPVSLFYEVKANLTRKQVQLLHLAGVHRIQPGIESLSDNVLKLMRKGTTGIRNIQLLKWCKQYKIAVDWNILYGFPGETREDYRATLELMRAIRFLPPPTACGPVRLDRFSPYYNSPGEFGLTNVRPLQAYEYLYPFDAGSRSRIAYYFNYDYQADVNSLGYADEVIRYAEAWKQHPEMGAPSSILRPDGTLVIVDTRSDALLQQLSLSGLERAAYEHCDEMHSVSSVVTHLRQMFSGAPCAEAQVRGFLDSLVSNRLMVTDGEHYLSLAIPVESVQETLEHPAPSAKMDWASAPAIAGL